MERYSHGPVNETPKNEYMNYVSYGTLSSKFSVLGDENYMLLHTSKKIKRFQVKVGDIGAHLRKILLSSRLPLTETLSHHFDQKRHTSAHSRRITVNV
jgi:hypothetical protein